MEPELPGGSLGKLRFLGEELQFKVASISDLKAEIFGPVLHIARWKGDPLAVIDQINALGYGLTIGIQTRIDSRAQHLYRFCDEQTITINTTAAGGIRCCWHPCTERVVGYVLESPRPVGNCCGTRVMRR